jgi:hypothetical protein
VNAAFTGITFRCVNAAPGRAGKEVIKLSNKSRPRRVRVRAVRRDPPDVRKLGKALLALAMAQAEAEAEAQAQHESKRVKEDSPRAA